MPAIDTNEKLRNFMEAMQRIQPPYGDLVQNGIPGQGQANTSAERTQEMKRLAVGFARAYQTKAAGNDEVQSRADELEGAVQTVATLGAIPTELANKLLDDLQELMDNREV